jgi:N4-gp56 family major capsid protein
MTQGLVWSTNTAGGFMYADELSDTLRTEVRATAKFRGLCDVEDFSDKGMGHGAVATWNVYSKLNTAGTRLTEGVAIPEAGFTVRQGTGTVYEHGNSVPFTSILQYYSAHSVNKIVRDNLARDAREALDREAHGQFNLTLLRAVGTTTANALVLTTNGTATATNNSALNPFHHRTIIDTMKERNIPAYMGDDYVAAGLPTAFRPLKNSLQDVKQYVDEGYTKILRGEIGRFDGCRFVEQTLIARGVSNSGTAWSNGLSDWIYYMGADTVADLMVVPPEVRGKIPSDYGRSLGMAWYALEGFGIVYTSGNDPSATNSRIVKWDSAV